MVAIWSIHCAHFSSLGGNSFPPTACLSSARSVDERHHSENPNFRFLSPSQELARLLLSTCRREPLFEFGPGAHPDGGDLGGRDLNNKQPLSTVDTQVGSKRTGGVQVLSSDSGAVAVSGGCRLCQSGGIISAEEKKKMHPLDKTASKDCMPAPINHALLW